MGLDSLDPRVTALVELFAGNTTCGRVSFPDGLVVELLSVPRAADQLIIPLTEEQRAKLREDERRAQYEMLLGRTVTGPELERLP